MLEKQFGPDAPLSGDDLATLDWLHRAERWHFIEYLLSLPKEQRQDTGYYWHVTDCYREIGETPWEHAWADWGVVAWLVVTTPE